MPEVSPEFIHKMARNASTATTAAMIGRRTRAPSAWKASEPV